MASTTLQVDFYDHLKHIQGPQTNITVLEQSLSNFENILKLEEWRQGIKVQPVNQ